MPSGVTNYEMKTVRTTRVAEASATDGLVQGGWEIVERKEKFLGRIELVARRQKQAVPMWAWVGGGGIAAALLVGVIIGASIPSGSASAEDATPAAVASSVTTAVSSSPTETPTVTAASTEAADDATTSPVTHKEVVTAFKQYFRERAAANVMVAKAVTKVSFHDGVVKVVFDPAAAGVTQDQFDAGNAFDNLAKFAATPIAFADETGNRLRPGIDEIKTVDADGASLGSFDRADILAQNELAK